MGWKNQIGDEQLDVDTIAGKLVDELDGDSIVLNGEEWWIDQTNDSREFRLTFAPEEPIYAKQVRVRVTVEIVEVPDEIIVIG